MTENIHPFPGPATNPSPRELLMRALSDADNVDEIIIIGHKKDTLEFISGTSVMDPYVAVGLLEALKQRLLSGIHKIG